MRNVTSVMTPSKPAPRGENTYPQQKSAAYPCIDYSHCKYCSLIVRAGDPCCIDYLVLYLHKPFLQSESEHTETHYYTSSEVLLWSISPTYPQFTNSNSTHKDGTTIILFEVYIPSEPSIKC